MSDAEKIAVLKMAGYRIFLDEQHEAWDWVLEVDGKYKATSFKYHDNDELATEDAWIHLTHQKKVILK